MARAEADCDAARRRRRSCGSSNKLRPAPAQPDAGVDAAALDLSETVHFEHAAQEVTLLDYLHDVEHVAERIERLERAIDDAVKTAPARPKSP